ncbi:MAG: AAA family ATPase, partial [Actinomycetota bacterium]|nr:AAA family ATPase [Actinomycetota bacterium]
MRVRVLGSFDVDGLEDRDLGSRKGRTLLKVLAVAEGSPVPVDRLADVLWGDEQPARPADQVGVLVSRLRAVLGPERIARTGTGYALESDWLDVHEVRNLAAAASTAMSEGRIGAARAAADAALALARGGLLPDEDGEWVEAARAAVDATVTRVARLAVDAAVAVGDHGAAASLAEQVLARDPYDEVVLRALMEAHLAAGRPASALAAYARFRARAAEELGVPPTTETEALHLRALWAADGEEVVKPAHSVSRAARPGIVGRTAELAVLGSTLADVAAGTPAHLVVVEGDAGIGKTTLVESWVAAVADAREAVVLWGRCDELGRDLPLQPVADALADHLRTLGSERADTLLGDDAALLAPLLGPVTGTAAGATVVTDPETARVRVFAALVGVLSRLGDAKPAVLVVEDLHVGGAGMLAWLAFARRRAQRTVIVVTTRPRGAQGLDATRWIGLGPLGRDAVAELVGVTRADALLERSGGHPLLLAALTTAAGIDDRQPPATLRDAVAALVDSVGRDVGATLRVAAVLGPDCDLELVAQVSGTSAVEVLAQLEAAARAGLIVERGSGFSFRHQLIREALEGATGAARRALVHQQAARALAGRPRPDPLAVAVHA